MNNGEGEFAFVYMSKKMDVAVVVVVVAVVVVNVERKLCNFTSCFGLRDSTSTMFKSSNR